MNKKIIINFLLFVGVYILPFVFLGLYKESIISIMKVQTPLYLFVLFGSILITYLNYKNKKRIEEYKIFWNIFFVIGIIGIILSGVILFLLFSFKNGIGF
jgi:hypothetical protein